LLSGEVLLGVAILIWVGVFTSLPPAKVANAMNGYAFIQWKTGYGR
jgi:hypothetical protein